MAHNINVEWDGSVPDDDTVEDTEQDEQPVEDTLEYPQPAEEQTADYSDTTIDDSPDDQPVEDRINVKLELKKGSRQVDIIRNTFGNKSPQGDDPADTDGVKNRINNSQAKVILAGVNYLTIGLEMFVSKNLDCNIIGATQDLNQIPQYEDLLTEFCYEQIPFELSAMNRLILLVGSTATGRYMSNY
jgi:hypothetical protein